MTQLPEIKIFRAGVHTDASGEERRYTADDVRRIAEAYNNQAGQHLAPAVKGHPENDQPAYGWVEKLRYAGGELFATFKDVGSAFAEELRSGRYKFRSIALYPSGLLKHVGFLGAVPPAVKGLGEIPQFADGVRYVYFADDSESAARAAEQPQQTTNNQGQTNMDEQAQQQLTELITGLSASVKELLAELKALKKPAEAPAASAAAEDKPAEATAASFGEKSELETKVRSLQQQVRAAQFREFLAGDGLKARVTPAMQPKVIELMNCLDDSGKTLKFSDAAGKAQESTAVEIFKQFLSELPVQYAEGELSREGVSAIDAEQSKEIDALAKHTSRGR